MHGSTKRAVRRRLEHARALIAQGWARGTFARDANNRTTNPESDEAVKFCALGACIRASYDFDGNDSAFYGHMRDVLHAAAGKSIVQLNDDSSRKEPVLRAFDRAIESLS